MSALGGKRTCRRPPRDFSKARPREWVSPVFEVRSSAVRARRVCAVLELANAEETAVVLTENHAGECVLTPCAKPLDRNHSRFIEARFSRHFRRIPAPGISALNRLQDFVVRQPVASCFLATSGERYRCSKKGE